MSQETLESIVLFSGYAGIFFLMISNGIISFPSSQILYIIAGYFVFTGHLNLFLVALVGAAGNTIGNIILYELARNKGISYITRWRIFPVRELKKIQIAFNKKGAWFLFVGKLLPAIKVFIPIPAGIAHMNRLLYVAIIATTSMLWPFPFLAIGYYFGKSANMFGTYAIILALIALVVATLFYKFMNSKEVISEIENGEYRN